MRGGAAAAPPARRRARGRTFADRSCAAVTSGRSIDEVSEAGKSRAQSTAPEIPTPPLPLRGSTPWPSPRPWSRSLHVVVQVLDPLGLLAAGEVLGQRIHAALRPGQRNERLPGPPDLLGIDVQRAIALLEQRRVDLVVGVERP